MATLTSTTDFDRVRNQQKTSAQDLFGRDPDAGTIVMSGARTVLPFTPPEYAELVWNDWAATFHTAALREAGASDLGALGKAILSRAREASRLPTQAEMDLIRKDADGTVPLTVSMLKELYRAELAYRGLSKLSPAKVRVLQGSSCATFWDAIRGYCINSGATRAVVTSGERWSAFFDGLNDSTQAIGEGVGQVAAGVLRQAGRVVGAGASGFLQELGIVETVIIIGAGVVAFKVIL